MADDPSTTINQQPISLKSTDKLQVVVFTAVITTALVAMAALAFKFFPVNILSSADDAPIVMAGGSFYMHASGIGYFNKDSTNHKLVHAEDGNGKLKVYAIDFIDETGQLRQIKNLHKVSGGQIVFKYCADPNCAGEYDTITVTFDNDKSDNLSIVNTDVNHTIDTFRNNNGIVYHPNTAWFLNRVDFQNWHDATVPVTFVTCGNTSHCTVIFRTGHP